MNDTFSLPLETRNKAYGSIQEELGERQKQVFEFIRCYGIPVHNAAIARGMRMGINQITPRVFELREMGLIISAGKGIDPLSGRSVALWKRA